MAFEKVSYAYDGSGLRTSMLDPEGTTVTYVCDTAGRLSYVIQVVGEADPDPENPVDDLVAKYSYDDAGRRTRLDLPNGCYASHAYDGAGRLLSVSNHKSDAGVISSFGYGLDFVGNREDLPLTCLP